MYHRGVICIKWYLYGAVSSFDGANIQKSPHPFGTEIARRQWQVPRMYENKKMSCPKKDETEHYLCHR